MVQKTILGGTCCNLPLLLYPKLISFNCGVRDTTFLISVVRSIKKPRHIQPFHDYFREKLLG